MLSRLLDVLEGRMGPFLGGGAVLLLLVGATVYTRQANVWVSAAEAQANSLATRVVQAEARASEAETRLTAVAREREIERTAVAHSTATAQAQATETVVALDPKASLEKALELVFEAYRDPVQTRVSALDAALGPDALRVFRPELDRLQTRRARLGGESRYAVALLDTTQSAPDKAEIRTSEEWVYDERDAADRQVRCLREVSEQTYVMVREPAGWLVERVLPSAATRGDC